MIRRTALFVTFAVLLFVLWGAGELISQTQPRFEHPRRNATAAVSVTLPEEPAEDELDEAVDFYGNEVTDAVAKYKRDSSGSLYEMHSPETEVPRLGSPRG